MKRIAGLPIAPDGLARFVADTGKAKTWDEFGNFGAGAARKELTVALVDRQHGLCAYCEIALVADDTRVEHFIPQSDPVQGHAQAVNHGNLLAVCMGGSNASFGPDALQPDPTRYLPPVKLNLSCDAAKGNERSSLFLDPRLTPAQPSLFMVNEEGLIAADPSSCTEQGVPVDVVEQHINRLRLNVGRLRNQREAVRAELTEAYTVFSGLPTEEMKKQLTVFAEVQLLADKDDRLARFFTTTRSFFGPLAERILEQPPHAWI